MRRAYLAPLLLTAALAVGACGVDSVGPGGADANFGIDAPEGQPDGDITPSMGLLFRFRSDPEPLPTSPDGGFNVVIENARIWLRDVRAVGDSAPGDSRTRINELTLNYNIGNSADGTLQFAYPNAPRGVYSFLIAEVVRYELEGTVEIDEEELDFTIEDEISAGRTINIDLKGQDLGSELLVVPIKSDLRKLAREVDWENAEVDVDEGEVEIDDNHPDLDKVNDKLGDVHRLDD